MVKSGVEDDGDERRGAVLHADGAGGSRWIELSKVRRMITAIGGAGGCPRRQDERGYLVEKGASCPAWSPLGLTTDLPVQCFCNTDWIRIPGKPFHGEHNDVMERDISPDYRERWGRNWWRAAC